MNDTMHGRGGVGRSSGRFVLRIDPGLHAALREAAGQSGLSLNEYCARKLALPASTVAGPASATVARAAALLGDALLGVLAYGSWARDELAQDSDVDVLIIVDRTCTIDRDLYRAWDDAPLTWEGRPVEPHFVHLPEPGMRLSGTWAAVAVDGVVLFERDLIVSRRLVEMRRAIVAGRLTERKSHGQSYWVEVA